MNDSSPSPDTQSPSPDTSTPQVATPHLAPRNRLDKVLAVVPRALSSHVHIIFLACLGVFLVILPLVGVTVSARAELIGGNYTNVTSDLGACIAAGLTVHLVRRDRKRADDLSEVLRKSHETLNREIQRAVTAAERAEAAASGSGSSRQT